MPALDSGAANDAAGRPTHGRRIVGRSAQSVIGAVAIATAMAPFARVHWIAELATHFPLQYAAAALVAGAASVWARRPVWALLALTLLGFNAHTAFAPTQGVTAAPAGTQPFRLLVANVFYPNTEHVRVIEFVRAARPDAAVFVEVTPLWRESLRTLERGLPYASSMTGRRHGVLVLSRWPLQKSAVPELVAGGDPFVHVRLDVRSRPLELIGVHAAWPLGSRNSRIRNRQLASLASLAPTLPKPLLIAGDFNATVHSPHFAELLAASGLRSAAAGRRWTVTWPTFFLPAGIQIDHVLVSEDIGVKRFETGPAVGSDHLPIVVDLVL